MRRYPSEIKFILDGEIKTLDFSKEGFKPTTTVLNYLRSLPGHKGVKEGCAEGDCGACTVVLASLDNRGSLQYESVDSCLIFLPMIHGKQLITVENLARKEGYKTILHPVQLALKENDGSQCGYCTPGIVMSMFALYKNHDHPTRDIITDSLTGNLCRCTGYRPIVDAAANLFVDKQTDQFTENEDRITALLQTIAEKQNPIEVISNDQHYLKPFTLEQAVNFRKEHPDARVVSGATDLALLQTKKRIHFSKILDISAVDELDFIVEDHSRLAIGSGTSLEELHLYTAERFPYLHDVITVFGSLQIRNMATIGGNIGTASPIGDLLPVLMALESEVRLMSKKGMRDISISQFITGYRQTNLEPDELIIMVSFRKPAKDEFIKTYKISKRKDLDISSVSGGFRLKTNEKGRIEKAMMAFGGLAATPVMATKTGEYLTGKPWNRETVLRAAKILSEEFEPISDARSSAQARKVMVGNLLIKFWQETTENSEQEKQPRYEG